MKLPTKQFDCYIKKCDDDFFATFMQSSLNLSNAGLLMRNVFVEDDDHKTSSISFR
jgi:hypothetical protein